MVFAGESHEQDGERLCAAFRETTASSDPAMAFGPRRVDGRTIRSVTGSAAILLPDEQRMSLD